MLTINLSEFILTVINFFVLLFLLKRFLYTPLIAFMEERNARIEAGLKLEHDACEAITEEEARNEERRKTCREEAKRILRDAQRADELRHTELMAETAAKNSCKRKEAKAAEIQRNEEEVQQLDEHRMRLAGVLADNLLGHFSDMPEILVGNGLRLAVEQAENTWDYENAAMRRARTQTDDERKRTLNLFAALADAGEDSERQKQRGS